VSESPAVWYELSTTADNEAIESVAELFARYGYNEGVAIEEPFLQEQDGDNLRIDTTQVATIRTYIPGESYDEIVVNEIRKGLWHLGQMRVVGELSISTRSEEDWASSWKAHYKPLRASNRVVIRPPWFAFEARPDDIVIVLDPGMAFGTGMHPTTRLSLLQIEKYVQAGCSARRPLTPSISIQCRFASRGAISSSTKRRISSPLRSARLTSRCSVAKRTTS
jgi:ribosomal protein L11 methyltransferase